MQQDVIKGRKKGNTRQERGERKEMIRQLAGHFSEAARL